MTNFEIWPFQMFKEYIIKFDCEYGNLSSVNYMHSVESHYKKYYNKDGCKSCNDTGCIPVYCCNGYECNCMGMPIDFILSCEKCGIRLYTEFKENH